MTVSDLLEQAGLAEWGAQAGWLLLDAGLKGFVLLSVAGVATMFMRRRSAATRHLVWTLAMAGLLVLPLVSVCVPKWHLPILPAKTPEVVAKEAVTVPAAPKAPSLVSSSAPDEAVENPQTPRTSDGGSIRAIASNRSAPVAARIPDSERGPSPTNIPWPLLAFSLWAVGAVVSATPLVFGMLAAHRLTRREQVIEGGGWRRLATHLEGLLHVRRTIRLLETGASTMPMAWGLRRSVVLLPEDAEGWPEAKRRVVLLHEFAHVKRRDCLTHAVARLAFAVHWFNPLAWVAMRRLRIERERACDDLVLNAGSTPADYADHLLHIARTMRNPSLASAAAITMARAGQLEKRLRAILDRTRNRGSVTPWALLLCVLVAVGAVVSVAVLDVTSDARGYTKDALFGRARAIRKTTLEARFFGAWRNLPFDISEDEEGHAKQCIELATKTRHRRSGQNVFESQETRAALETILAERPGYFYAEYLLGTWHRLAGNEELSRQYRQNAYQHAPVVIVQRYQREDGSPVVGVDLQMFALECNRVQKGSLDPSLELYYPALTTDQHGAVYLPVYDTVYRRSEAPFPKGSHVDYPRLGWFEARGKVGLLPTAKTTPTSPKHASASPVVTIASPGTSTEKTNVVMNVREVKTVDEHLWVWQVTTDEKRLTIADLERGDADSVPVDANPMYILLRARLEDGRFSYLMRVGKERDFGPLEGKSDMVAPVSGESTSLDELVPYVLTGTFRFGQERVRLFQIAAREPQDFYLELGSHGGAEHDASQDEDAASSEGDEGIANGANHVIWQGYAVTNDAGLLLTKISVRPNEKEWYSLGNPRDQASVFSPTHRPFPHTYLLRTQKGSVGLLQVDGLDGATQRVEFRYRMLEVDGV